MKKRFFLLFVFIPAAFVTFSQTVDEYLDRGDWHFLAGRLHEARLSVEDAIRLDPNYVRAHLHLGSILYNMHEYILALGAFSRAIELDSTFAEAYFWRALIHDEILNDPANARNNYDMAIYLDPENDRYRLGRGIFLSIVVGDFMSALIDFDRAVEIDPLNYENFQQRGVSFGRHGFHELALDDLNVAIRLNNENARNFFNKGVMLYYLERYEEALENYNSALRLDSSHYRAYSRRGHAHFRLGMYHAAVLDFSEIIRLKPTNTADYRMAYYSRAFLFRLLADQTDNPAQAAYYRDRARMDEQVVARLDGQGE